MSGDVQPRKRKDKKRKKDELGLEEPRGTAAVLGEGDVFIHSYHEHGTGGHWCAKIIFFSLLAVLVTLIGLIILENRGLSELEANSVETRYSGVLEGWIDDALEDDHHDEHTLELKHPDDEELPENDQEQEIDEEDDHDEVEDNNEELDSAEIEELDSEEIEDINEDGGDDQSDEEDIEDIAYSAYHINEEQDKYLHSEDYGKDSAELKYEQSEEEDDNDEEYSINQNNKKDDYNEDIDDDEDSDTEHNDNKNDDDKWQNDEDDQAQDEDDDDSEEVERIEREVSDEDVLSSEVHVPEEIKDLTSDDAEQSEEDVKENDERSIEDEDDDEPPMERITLPPAGKPYTEIEEETIQKTPNTLAEEEEYEKQQEELRLERQAQSSQGMWLKLVIGGALLVATHAVLRRATAPRDEPDTEEEIIREEPSVIERRMTLIPKTEETPDITQRMSTPSQEEIIKQTVSVIQSVPALNTEDNIKNQSITKEIEEKLIDDDEKELYSDEDEEEEEVDVEEEAVLIISEAKDIQSAPVSTPVAEESPDEDEDVEIIDEEQIEEELEDEEDEVEEEISDVDDTELLSRLEAKYGRLPEPERPGKNKGGGNSIEEDWPGEPSDPFWSQQLDLAEEELRQGAWSACERRATAMELRNSARAQWLAAKSLDLMAEAKRDNRLLSRAITAYLQLLKMNEKLPDQKLIEVAQRAIDRIQFRGTYLNAEPVYRLLIRRFPDNIHYRNNLTVCFLMANRADLAGEVLKEALRLWPNDRVALAHYGFVLKNQYNKLEEAVIYLQKALEDDAGAADEPRFYYHLGDALLQLGRFEEAHEVHKRGTALGHFLSPAQRSLYNVPRLKSRPWWPIRETPYAKLAAALEKSWREILKEGLAAKALYEQEKEGLKERGEWSQLDIFVRGKEIPGRCKAAPVTCSIVRQEAAAGCRRGQVKFSAIEPGTHVRPHVGPTNCRLRMHLGLSNTKDTYIRVDKETRQWEVGKVFIFDDSFEHEVWHNGTGSRLVLIVDVWHPDLTPAERRSLPAI